MLRENTRRNCKQLSRVRRPKIDRELGLIIPNMEVVQKKENFSKIVKGLFDPVVFIFNYHDR